MDLNLNGKYALVCGSTQGIGKATAIELVLAGAHVTLVARDEVKLQAVVKELQIYSGLRHDYIVADFNNPDELKNQIDLAIFLQKGAIEVIYEEEKYFIVPQASILMLEREEEL